MKRSLFMGIIATLAMVGCSASPTPVLPDGAPATNPVTSPTIEGSDTTGAVDCAVLTSPDIQTGFLGIQILAQLRTQGVVDSIKDGVVAYDPDKMATTLEQLRVLAGRGVAGFGDPGDSVDFYLGANTLAAGILTEEGLVPQEKFDELIAYEGEIADFLYRQIPITAALDENCG